MSSSSGSKDSGSASSGTPRKTASSGGYDYSSLFTVEPAKKPAGEDYKVYADWGSAEHANNKDTPSEPAKNCYESGSTEQGKSVKK